MAQEWGPVSAEDSQLAIEAGGLPPDATRRLNENAARQGTPSHLFTSNLSVNEFLLTRECGYEPLGQVMGCCVFHVGWQWMPSGGQWTSYGSSQELTVLTQGHRDARERAFSRLRQEAAILRADGVVGVRLVRSGVGLSAESVELQAIGTAVRKVGSAPSAKAEPFLSNLSGQDHWAIRQMGMRPVGFVFGNCTWYQMSSWSTQTMNSVFAGNNELPDYTQAVYTAREVAMNRLEYEARALNCQGVVGVTIEPSVRFVERGGQNSNGVLDMIAEFTVFGTAIDWEHGQSGLSDPIQCVVPVS